MSGDSRSVRNRIRTYMKSVITAYSELRGNTKDNFDERFWDAVIISASDFSQKLAYEKQIVEKQQKKELPLDVPFHVFSDKPGYKNGCGGSTMYVLEKLQKIYGNSLFNMCLLLIPAGGFSQRLPSLSVLGKLFCPLPFGNLRYQMIDLILATYLPFVQNMSAGIFLASSDAIISFCLSSTDQWTFKNEGFTALAHPSPLNIGTGHGVYVLPKNQDFEKNVFMSDCLKVLQKPTEQEMFDQGAVVICSMEGCCSTSQMVFSDSAFFFDQRVAQKLIHFYEKAQPLKCELSSYGDFLRPLGLNFKNLVTEAVNGDDDLTVARQALCNTLQDSRLSILVMKESQFHHLGTMPEYIDSFSFRNEFSFAFSISRFSFSAFSVQDVQSSQVNGTVIHSVIHPMSVLPASSVIEYCDISIPVDIGENCLVSNCQCNSQSAEASPIKISDDVLLHTVCLKDCYVTIACGIFDDVKQSYTKDKAFDVQIFGVSLNAIFQNPVDDIFDKESKSCSLWNAKLFSLCDSMDKSLQETVKLVTTVTKGDKIDFETIDEHGENIVRVSMEEVLLLKDIEGMLSFQNMLYDKISKIQEEELKRNNEL